ncbi:MAG: hypothetical protein ACNA8L_02135 [Luteolibacter sp.]|jgi:hypothetical protein
MTPHFLSIVILLSAASAMAQETLMRIVHDTKTDTHVEVLGLFTHPAPGGYLPLRVTIVNNQNRAHRIELKSEAGNMYGNRGARSSAVFAVSAEPGRVVTRDILVPTLPGITGGGIASNLTLRLSGTMGSDEHHDYQNTSNTQPRVLLSHRLFTVNGSALDSAASSAFGSSHRGGSTRLGSRFEPKQLPSEWLAYGAYDWMVLTDEDWAEIPAGQRNAILAWVRLGGNLDVRHRMDSFNRGRLGLPENAGFGTISGAPIGADLKLDATQFVRSLSASRVLATRGKSLSEDFDRSWPLQQHFGTKSFHFGIFLIVLAAFAILVGPVNLFFLASSGKRHRLFVTTPLISLGASLVMVGLIIFQDGFGGKGARVLLMEVRPDDGQNAAFIHQEQFSRTGILTRTGFEAGVPALIHPVPIAQNRWARFTNRHDSGGTFNLQPSGAGIAATGEWFQSRSEQGHFLSAVTPSRGRIESDGNGGFVSTFPHRIDVIFLRETGGGWLMAEDIATGISFKMRSVPADEATGRLDAEARDWLTARLKEMLDRVKTREGHFIAISTSAPGIDTHAGVRWTDTRAIISGPLAR